MASWRTATPPRRPRGTSQQATAILAAAGSGQRLGAGGPKALATLAGRPLYEWSLDALRSAESIGRIVIAAPPGHEAEFAADDADAADAADGADGADVVAGGVTRSDSVLAALALVETELVAIHDAARPLISPELVDSVVGALAERPDAGGVVAAAPVTDTIKRSAAARPADGAPSGAALTIAETPRREVLWAAQTPQVFRTATLREAIADEELRVAATDEASLVESAGGLVLLYPNPDPNPKVTVSRDLTIAAALLGDRPADPT